VLSFDSHPAFLKKNYWRNFAKKREIKNQKKLEKEVILQVYGRQK
jgi:hypothetical protein